MQFVSKEAAVRLTAPSREPCVLCGAGSKSSRVIPFRQYINGVPTGRVLVYNADGSLARALERLVDERALEK